MGGAFGAAFIGALGDKAKERSEQIRQNQQHMKDMQADFYLKSMQSAAANGTLTPEMKDYAMGQVQKIYGNTPEMKQLWGKFNGIIDGLHGHIQDQTNGQHGILSSPDSGQQPASQASTGMLANATASPDQLKELNGGASADTSSAPSSSSPVLTPPPMAPQNVAQLPKPPSGSAANGVLDAVASAPPPSMGAATPTPPLPGSAPALPPSASASLPQMPAAFSPQASPESDLLHAAYLNPTQQGERALQLQAPILNLQHRNAMEEKRMEMQMLMARLKGTSAPSQALTIDNAIKLQEETGQSFQNNQGQEVDLGSIKRAVGGDQLLQPTLQPGGGMTWSVSTPKLGIANAGNEVLNRSLYSGKVVGDPIGIQHPERVTSRQAPGAMGTVNTFTNTSGYQTTGPNPSAVANPVENTPSSTPILKRRDGSIVQPGEQLDPKTLQTPPGAPTAKKQPLATAAATPPPEGKTQLSRSVNNLTPGEWDKQINVIRPVREFATQVFGDPTSGSEGLLKYAKLYDDPVARQKVATAIALTFGGMPEDAEKENGLYSILKNYGGVPPALSASQVAAANQAIAALDDPKYGNALHDWYDTFIASRGLAIGMRSISRASAGKFSVKAIEQELPYPDVTTNSSQAFYNRMSKLGEQVYNATSTLSPQVLRPGEDTQYHGLVKNMLALRDTDSNRAKTNPKTLTAPPVIPQGPINTADDLMNYAKSKAKSQ